MSQTDVDTLSRWRTLGARNSEKVVRLAPRVLAAGGLGDTVREQLAIAALDLGKIMLAQDQIEALETRFPDSPRVDILLGMKCEAEGDNERAREVYGALLREDGTNVRMIALTLPDAPVAIERLLSYLDTFYADPQGWSLLAELYAEQGAYAQSLTALGHLMLLQTWDSHAVLRAAETAYTLGDSQLALKHFLRVAEMQTPPGAAPAGHDTRAWWGVKRAVRRLLVPPPGAPATTVPDDEVTKKAQLFSLDELATERILDAGGADLAARRDVLAQDSRLP